MERVNISYSSKNIPIPNDFFFKKTLVSKIEDFISRMRWKLFWAKNPQISKNKKEYWGFKTPMNPAQMKELKPFEDDLFEMAANIKFKTFGNKLQEKLKKDVKEMKSSNEIYIKADKTGNIYKMKTDEYKKNLLNQITKEYKKEDTKKIQNINKEAAQIAKKLEIDDRVEIIPESEPYITIKDHKENFPIRMDFRLINPAKSEIGKISKIILQKANKIVREFNNFEQWTSSDDVIKWFNGLTKKKNTYFLQYDIEAFYPSITESLLMKALEYIGSITQITDEEKDIILHARKSALFYDGNFWTKRNNPNFDVTMGAWDGAEVAETVGLYLLWRLSVIIPKQLMGLYRDDGLMALELSGPEFERVKKSITKIFKEYNLNILVSPRSKIANFLDLTFNLEENIYKPYIKENSTTCYVHKMSNHPDIVKKNIPKMIKNRIVKLSSNQDIFEREIKTYNEALTDARYNKINDNTSCGGLV